ncbi:cytochrome P450 [Bosea sp. (in: a-proteobacteria)]|uniref:cytochrome P450 n=1 Tax=Bosea sp. (in: a-proteobacteria) TaxID=1871050 RepID=UPI0027358917|nr:cytochrome P450 [Bosea sp. (in: a-proteobacteria)]MDP3410360.1 cytochrome P450 [Bosea sp. (in: a-proteobacteria)]
MLDTIQDVPVIPSADLETDPHGTLRRYRASHPFAALETGGYIVLGYEDVSRLASDPRLQATETALPAQAGLSQGALFDIFAHGMLTANGGVHQDRRSPMSRALIGEVAEQYRLHVRRSAHALIDRCFADGGMELVGDYAAPLPARGLAGLLGVPAGEIAPFLRDIDAMNAFFRPDATAATVASAEKAAARVRSAIMLLLDCDGDDQAGGFLQHYARLAETELRHARVETLMQIVQLIIGGTESVRTAIVAQTANLLANPLQWQAVCKDPERVPAAVAEAMRFEPGIAGLVRVSAEDIDIEGRRLPAGQLVVLSLLSALRDERIFDRPNVFDIFRLNPGPSHLGFGGGPHRCVADALGRAALQEALSVLTERLPHLRLDQPPVFSGHVFVRGNTECRVTW